MREEKSMAQKETWQELAKKWESYTEPGRPSRDECRVYNSEIQRAIRGVVSPKVLVLGATPEIRSILLKYSLEQKAEISLADINKNMAEAMSLLVDFPNEKEQLFICDWLNLPFEKGFFDVVIGDLVVTNVALEDKARLLKSVRDVLKAEGRFITKSRVFEREKDRSFTIQDTLTKYINEYKNLEISLNQAITYFFIEISQQTYYLNGKKEYSLKYLIQDLESLRGRITDPLEKMILEKFYKDYSPLFEKVWVGLFRDEDKELFQSVFEIENTYFANDHPFGKLFPVYVLKKK